MPSALETAIARHRAELVAADDVATKALVDAYVPARKRLQKRITALLAAQADAVAEGGALTPTEVLRLDRSRELLAQVDAEMARLASVVAQEATTQQEAVIGLADRHALVEATLSAATRADAVAIATSWNRVNTGAAERLVGRMSNGSPLSDLLDTFVTGTGTNRRASASAAMRDVLLDGVARGLNADALGRELTRVADVGLAKAQQISRDAILGSYRDATLDRYGQNADILDGWYWLAAHQTRTCLACLGLSGEFFGLDVTFQPTHSRCRCRARPGLKGAAQTAETGQEWLDRQPAKTRREMFPPGARDAYDAGDLTLADFKQREEDDRWGPSYRQASITQARANAKARRDERPDSGYVPYPHPFDSNADHDNPIKARREALMAEAKYLGADMDLGADTTLMQATVDALRLVRSQGTYRRDDGSVWQAKIRAEHRGVGGPIAVFTRQGNTVYINTDDRTWTYPAERRELFDKGWFSAPMNADTMTHEFGHHIHYEAVGEAWWKRNSRQELTDYELSVASDVSRYAMTDPVEFVAEVFSGRLSGKVYPDRVMEQYRKFKGPEPSD